MVKGQEHLLVEKDHIEEVKGVRSSLAGKDRMEATAEKRTVTVGGDEAHQVGESWHLRVGNNIFLEGMTSGVIELHKGMTLKAPGGFIRIDGSGITIEGKVVNINTGGAPGSGFPVQAVPARNADRADSREAGSGHKSQVALTEQSEVARSEMVEQSPLISFGNNSFVASPISGVTTSSTVETLPAGLAASFAPVLLLMHDAPIEMEQLKSGSDAVAREWRKTVLDAQQENSISGKMEIVNTYVQKNVALTPDGSGTQAQAPGTLLQSGRGSELECASAKYYTLKEAGVSADSMHVVTTDQGTLLAVQDGPRTLFAGPEYTPGIPMVRDSASLASDITPLTGFNAGTLFTFTTA